MATTTNYGWTTPDDTALVKDGAAAIRTLGSSVDTTTKALNPSTTLGDIEYRSSTANTNTRLGIGSTGQVLTVSGGVPVWAAAGGSSKVVQIVTATTNTQVSNATTTYADTTLTATITPTSASNKVLVFVSQNGLGKTGSSTMAYDVRLLRTATEIGRFVSQGGRASGSDEVFTNSGSFAFLDSPATTSATTYKTQIKATTANFAVHVQYYNPDSSIILMEVTP